jgi:hypothetical protein
VHLIGRSVANLGTIEAPRGVVALVAGEEVYLGERFGRIHVQVSGPALGVDNPGTIAAPGGQALLAAGDLYSAAIQHHGLIRAADVRVAGHGSGTVEIAGVIDAASTASDTTGGRIEITGERLHLAAGADLDVSGPAGGGTLLVGGDYQGGNPDVRNARAVFVEGAARLRADALAAGRGGRIIIWSDEATRFHGGLWARGAGAEGEGGFAEVSGREFLDFRGRVDLRGGAPGLAGTLLLDPTDLTINDGLADVAVSPSGAPIDQFVPTGDGSTLTWTSILGALAAANVVVTTVGSPDTGAQTGMITIAESPDSQGNSGVLDTPNALSFVAAAGGGIAINASIVNNDSGSLSFSTSGGGGISLAPGTSVSNLAGAVSFTAAGNGTVSLGNNAAIAGGTVTFNHGGTLSAGAGSAVTATTLVLEGAGDAGAGGARLAFAAPALTLAKSGGSVFLSRTGAGSLAVAGSTGGALDLLSAVPITQGAPLAVAGAASFATRADGGAAITLTDTGNVFGTFAASARNAAGNALAAGAISVAETGALQLGLIETAGSLGVSVAGPLTQTADGLFAGASTFTLRGTIDATAALASAANNLTSTVAFVTPDTAAWTSVALRNVNATAAFPTLSAPVTSLTLVHNNAAVALPALSLSSLDVTAGGAITDTGDVVVSGTASFNAVGQNITLDNAGTDLGTLVVTAANNVAVTDANVLTLGTSSVAGSFAATANTLTLGGNVTTDGGALTLTGNVVVPQGASRQLSTGIGAGDVTITGTTAGTAGGPSEILTVVAGTGSITFGGNVGAAGTDDLETLTLTSANNVTFSGTLNLNGILTQTAGTGTTTFDGAVTVGSAALTGNAFALNNSFASTLSAAFVNTGAVTKSSTGAITAAGGFSTTGPLTLANNLTTTNNPVAIGGLLTIAEAAAPTIATGGGAATFTGGVQGTTGGVAEGLTVNTGAGNITFSGAVGNTANATELESLTLTTTGNTQFAAGLNLAGAFTKTGATGNVTLTGTSTAGSVTFAGSNLTVNDAFTVAGGVTLALPNNGFLTLNSATLSAGGNVAVTGNLRLQEQSSVQSTLVSTAGDVTVTRDVVVAPNLGTGTVQAFGTVTLNSVGGASQGTNPAPANPGDPNNRETLNIIGNAGTYKVLGGGANQLIVVLDLNTFLGPQIFEGLVNFNKSVTFADTVTLIGATLVSAGAVGNRDLVFNADLILDSGASIIDTRGGLLSLSNVVTAVPGAALDLTLAATNLTLSGTITTAGTVTFLPTLASDPINIGNGSPAGGLRFTSAFLNQITDGTAGIVIGRDDGNHAVTLQQFGTLSFRDPTTVRSGPGGSITLAADTRLAGTNEAGIALLGGTVTLADNFLGPAISTSTGPITLGGAVQLSGATLLQSTGGGAVSLTGAASTINGAHPFTIATTGPITLAGTLGGTTPLSSVSFTSGGTSQLRSITTSGTLALGSAPVALVADTVWNAGAITAAPLVVAGGGFDLTLTSAGGVPNLIGGNLSGIANFTRNGGGGGTTLSGTLTTTGAQSFPGSVFLAGHTVLNATTFNLGSVVGFFTHGLTLNHSAAATFGGGTFGSLTSLTIGGGGATTLSGTFGTFPQTYLNPVTLGGATNLNGSTLSFGSTVNGAHALALGGNAAFAGLVGNTTPLASLSVTGTTGLGAGVTELRTTGNQTLTGAVTLGANTSFVSTAGAAALGAVTGAGHNLTVQAATTAGLAGGVAGVGAVSVTATTANVAGTIASTGNQTYTSNLQLTGATALNSTGGDIAVTGAVNGATTLAATAGGALQLGGAVGGITPLTTLTATSTGPTTLAGGTVATSGNQTYHGGVVVTADTTFSGATGRFNAGLQATGFNIALNFSEIIFAAGTFTMDTLVTGATSLMRLGGTITTTGVQTYGGTAQMEADAILNASTVTFQQRLFGAHSLTINGNAVFNGWVGSATGEVGANQLTALTVTGATTLNPDVPGGGTVGAILTTGPIQLGGAVTLGNALVHHIGGTSAIFGSTVDGAATINRVSFGSGPTSFGGSVGATTALTNLSVGPANFTGATPKTVRVTGTATLNGAIVSDGALSFDGNVSFGGTSLTSAGPVTLGTGAAQTVSVTSPAGLLLDTSAAGAAVSAPATVVLSGPLHITTGAGPIGLNAVNGNHALTLNSATGITLGGALGAGPAANRLASVTATGPVTATGGSVNTTGNQTYHGAVALGADTTFFAANAGATLGFAAGIDGAHALALSAGNFNLGPVGTTTPLTSLVAIGSLATLNGPVVRTTGTQQWLVPVALAADTTVVASTATFANTVRGPGGLLVDGNALFSAGVGGVTPLAFLTVTGGAQLNGGFVTTSGVQDYQSAATFGSDLTLTGSAVSFASALDSAAALTVVGDATFGGAIGSITPLAALSVSGDTTLTGGSVTTVGQQVYSGDVFLAGNTDLTASLVDIGGTVDGALALAVFGAARFGGLVGGVTPLSSLAVTGLTTLASSGITTTGNQTYGGGVALAGDTTLTGALVAITGGVDGGLSLAVVGDAQISGAIGSVTALDALTITGAATLGGTLVRTTGAQTFGGDTTVTSDIIFEGADVLFAGALDGAVEVETVGNLTLGGVVGGTTPLTRLVVWGPAALNGGAVTTTAEQFWLDDVTLGAATALTGSFVGFAGTLDGAFALAIDGESHFIGDVGSAVPLLSLVASGPITFDTAAVTTTGGQNWNGAATLLRDVALTGATVRFGGPLDGAHAVAITGDAQLDAAIGQGTVLTSLQVNGATMLAGGAVATSGTQNYLGAATLAADTTLVATNVDFGGTVDGAHLLEVQGAARFGGAVGGTAVLTALTVSGAAQIDAASIRTSGAQTFGGASTLGTGTLLTASAVAFGSTVDGAHALGIAGDATFSGSLGGTTPLASVAVSGSTALNGGAFTTTGTQTFSGPATLGTDNTFTGSLIGFGAALEGAHTATILGNAAFGGVVGGLVPLASLSVSGMALLDAGAVTTTGTQFYGGAIDLTAGSVLTGSSVTFGGTVDGAFPLSVVAAATFAQPVGSVTPLASLAVTGAVNFNGGTVTTSGNQTYGGAATLGAATTLGGASLVFGGAIDGAHALSLLGTVSFGGPVGAGTALASLNVGGPSTVAAGTITTTGGQLFGGAVSLAADLVATGATVEFAHRVDGAFALTVNGATTFGDDVGSVVPLTFLTINGPAVLDTASITTTGGQTFGGTTTIAFDTTLTGTLIQFAGTLDGANALTIVGDAGFAGAVGSVTPLTQIAVSGATALNGATVRTTGTQTYTGAAALGGDSTLTASRVVFGGPVDGAAALAIAGDATLSGPVGATTALTSLTVSGDTAVNGGSVATTGTQVYAGEVALGGNATLTASAVTFGGPLSGPFSMTVAGSAVFDGAVGAGVPLASLLVTGTAGLNGAAIATSGAQTYTGAATLGGATTLTGSVVQFGSTLDGPFALTIAGDAVFGGVVGGNAPLASLEVTGQVALNAGAVNTTGPQTYVGAAGLGLDNILTGSLVTFATTADGAFALAILGDALFAGAVGDSLPLATLGVSGALELAGADVTTLGGQTYSGPVTLSGASALTGAEVLFGGPVDGGFALAVTADTDIAAPVGSSAPLASFGVTGATRLDAGSVTTAGSQTYSGPFTVLTDATLAGAAIEFDGTLDGAHSLGLVGATTFSGTVGGAAPLSALSVAGSTTVATGAITTVGAQSYDGPVSLQSASTLTGASALFTQTVDGAQVFAVVADATFGGAVGGSVPLAQLEVTGATTLAGGRIDTTGRQTFTGTTTLAANTTLVGTSIVFDGLLDGAFALALEGRSGGGEAGPGVRPFDANATAVFLDRVGSVAPLASLAVNGSGTIGASSISTTGDQDWRGPVVVAADTTLAAATVRFNAAVDGARELTVQAEAFFGGPVGGTTPLAALRVTGGTTINAASLLASGGLTFEGTLALGADTTLRSLGGDIGVFGTVGSPNGRSLTLLADVGYAEFRSPVGVTGGVLGSLTVESNDMQLSETVTSGNQSFRSAAGAVMSLLGDLRSEGGSIAFSSVRSEIPVIATIVRNTPGDLNIEAPQGDFSMGQFERLVVTGGKSLVDEGGNLNLTVGGLATLGDFAVSRILTVRADRIDIVGQFIQAADIAFLSSGGTLLPISSITFRGAPQAADDAKVSLSTRNATPFAPASPSFILRLLDPTLFGEGRIDPEKFPTQEADGRILFPVFNIFPVFLASSRTNLSEVLAGATPTASVEVTQEATISAAVREQLVLLGIFARRLTTEEHQSRRLNRTVYRQIIPAEAREPEQFEVADARISQAGAVEAVALYGEIFTRPDATGAAASRIPEIQSALGRAFRAFREASPAAEPAAFAEFLENNPHADGAGEVRQFLGQMAQLFRTIESLGLTDQEIAVSKTVLLRPLRVTGLPAGVLRRIVETIDLPAGSTAQIATPSPPPSASS